MLNHYQASGRYTSARAASLSNEVVGVVRGYIAIWGDPDHRDSYDTWWDRERPAEIGMKFVPFPLCYEHGDNETLRKEIIGSVDRIWIDDTGYAFEGHLDPSNPFFDRVVAELRRVELKTSSATGSHLVEFYDDGAFKSWPLVELSFTKYPAESRMPAVQLLRSLTEQPPGAAGGDELPSTQSTRQDEDTPMNAKEIIQQLIDAGADAATIIGALLEAGISIDDLASAVQQLVPPEAGSEGQLSDSENPEDDKPADEEESETRNSGSAAEKLLALINKNRQQQQRSKSDAVVAALSKIIKSTRNAPPPKDNKRFVAGDPAFSVQVSEPLKYWGRSRQELMFGYLTLRAEGKPVSEEYCKVMVARAFDGVQKNDPVMNHPAVRSSMKSTRANEVMISTAAGGGDEWVSIAYSSDLWEKARENRIFQQLVAKGMRVEEVPQGAESIYILTEGSDPTVYTISQNANLDATNRPSVNIGISRPGTGRELLTPGELGMAVAYSDVFEEDSLIPVLSQLQAQMDEKAEETIEQLFLNGDTATAENTNINLIDGTPGSALASPYYLASDGALKYALVTGSGTSRDGGTLDEDDFRLTLRLFPSAIRSRKANIALVFDSDTHSTALGIPALKTDDVRHTNATITSGVLENIYGVDTLESGFMLKANSAGKVPSAGGTLGRLLGVYAPYWAMGWKRRARVETGRDIISGTNLIVVKFRLGFKPRGAGAAVATYNLTIN